MNHLANGGHLHKLVSITFKGTPVAIGIPLTQHVYHKVQPVLMPPETRVSDELFNRMYTGNIRAECGFTRRGDIFSYTIY